MASALLDSLLTREAPARDEPAWLAAARAAAASALAREGLPGPREEAWKYTSLRALEQRRYAPGDADASRHAIDASALELPDVDGPRLVFVNGVLRADLSRRIEIEGLALSTLAAASAAELDAWREPLAHGYSGAAAAFAQLNTALAADGPLLRVAAGAKIAAPVHLVFVGAGGDVAWNARLLVDLGQDSALSLVEHHVAASDGAQLGNLVTQIALGARARLDLVQIQDAPAAATLIRRSDCTLGEDAELRLHTLELGAQTTRHDLAVALSGRGAKLVSRGVFALRGRQHADTHLDIRHEARDSASDILWRGVADERARGVFHGAITVAHGADGSDAQLANKNLLLSANAEIDTQPVLEIYADEVKAAHGATVGQLDERALFYLRSRGIAPDVARRLLIAAFCSEALDGLAPRLREHLGALLAVRLPQAEEALA